MGPWGEPLEGFLPPKLPVRAGEGPLRGGVGASLTLNWEKVLAAKKSLKACSLAKCSAASSFAVYIYFQLFRVLRFTSINSVLPTSYPSTLVPAARFLSWNAYRSLSECISYVFL